MNYHVARCLIADRQAAINASVRHGALVREAMATRASRPARAFHPSLALFRVARAIRSGLVRLAPGRAAHPAL
jgi:hypothetical protein